MACSGRPLRFLVISLGLWLQYAALDAQTSRGSVTGIVTDTQKAAILNAKIELTGLGTNLTRTTRTNGSGLYRFEAVDPGAYKLTVQSIGFRTTVAPRVTVNAGLVTTEDTTLEVGDLQQVVEVYSSPAGLRTESTVRGGGRTTS